MTNSFGSQGTLPGADQTYTIYRLAALQKSFPEAARLPYSLKVLLENLLRTENGRSVRREDIEALARWQPKADPSREIAFTPSRVLMQDFTGVPAVVDLAAMRDAIKKLGGDPRKINPLQPAELVIDHSVQVDDFGNPQAFAANVDMEYARNKERYAFLRWGQKSFRNFKVVPPGTGICHQVNLEYLGRVVFTENQTHGKPSVGLLAYPDTLVGTDSHTTMINGLGVLAWGVGGIEAEAAMLGQPVYFLTPDVVGVNLSGRVRAGVTATDVVLTVTEMLRKAKVVGKFVEFHGEGASALGVPERATIANMAPEYGATIGYFPVDELTCQYLLATRRPNEPVDRLRAYYQEQGLFGIPKKGQVDYTQVVELDLASVNPSVSGPKRPQDRIELPNLKGRFLELLQAPSPNGYGKPSQEIGKRFHEVAEPLPMETVEGGGAQDPETVPDVMKRGVSEKDTNPHTEMEMMTNRPTPDRVPPQELHPIKVPVDIGHGDVLIAAITSCTNTSNPSVMLAAGLLAKKAVEKGLHGRPEGKDRKR